MARVSVKKNVAPWPGCDSTQMRPPCAFDDLLADGQAGAGAFVLVALMQSAEDAENLLVKRRVDADAVVAHEDGHVGPGSIVRAAWRR